MQLPSGVMRPTDLVAAASQRLGHAQAVLGPVEIVGITELSPCWRPLLQALTHHTAVSWTAGPRPTPSWLEATGVTVTRSAPQTPALRSVSAAGLSRSHRSGSLGAQFAGFRHGRGRRHRHRRRFER